jgi:hypothetical protein
VYNGHANSVLGRLQSLLHFKKVIDFQFVLVFIFLFLLLCAWGLAGSEGDHQALACWPDTAGSQQTVRVGR